MTCPDPHDEQLQYALRVERDIEALRGLPTGWHANTLVGTYAMNGESTRGEGRWYWLELDGRRVSGTPDSGRPDAVRRFAVRHYRDLIERQRLHGQEAKP